MKNFTAILASFALVAAGMTFVAPTVAKAQSRGATCQANSPVAFGLGQASTVDMACSIALRECAIRTPYSIHCVVTRWWWN